MWTIPSSFQLCHRMCQCLRERFQKYLCECGQASSLDRFAEGFGAKIELLVEAAFMSTLHNDQHY